MYKNDLALNELHWLIYHKTQAKQTFRHWLDGTQGSFLREARAGLGPDETTAALVKMLAYLHKWGAGIDGSLLYLKKAIYNQNSVNQI